VTTVFSNWLKTVFLRLTPAYGQIYGGIMNKKMSIQGWSTVPTYYEFTDAFVRPMDGRRIDEKFVIYVRPENDQGAIHDHSIRCNIWGPLAKTVKKAIMDTPRVVKLYVKDAKVTPYICPKTGVNRYSLNINSPSEVSILEHHPWEAEKSDFHALLSDVPRRASSDFDNLAGGDQQLSKTDLRHQQNQTVEEVPF
jgi:hypothetical protein